MSDFVLYLLPVLFLVGICCILNSLSRRATPPAPPMPGLEERRLAAAVAEAERREREGGSHVSADFVAAELTRMRSRRARRASPDASA